MQKKFSSLLVWIVIFQLTGYFMGKITQLNLATWYQTLHKSTLTPSELIFPIVWSILYVMIAVAGWWLWQQRKKNGAKSALFFYAVQVLMNWTWTPLFFQFHFIGLGFYWIIGIFIFTLITILLSWNKFKLSALMLTPYCGWLLFAGYLNWVIWMKN